MTAADHLMTTIANLRGFRCAEQRPFLAMVESVGRQAVLVLDERQRYRDALVQIADAESGRWGWIAFDALHPERKPHDAHGGSDGG